MTHYSLKVLTSALAFLGLFMGEVTMSNLGMNHSFESLIWLTKTVPPNPLQIKIIGLNLPLLKAHWGLKFSVNNELNLNCCSSHELYFDNALGVLFLASSL